MKIIITADGSPTLLHPQLAEHYHSLHGARTESQHIFIHHALERRLLLHPPLTHIHLLEIGFGTGLNALLTLLYSQQHLTHHLTYHTYEPYPLPAHTLSAYLPHPLLAQLHQAEWETPTPITPHFTLIKRCADATTAPFTEGYDVVYLDPFSPEKAPHLWGPPFLQKIFNACHIHATLSTYCAKGAVRRTLQQVGFEVTRTLGPPQGKREILTCLKP